MGQHVGVELDELRAMPYNRNAHQDDLSQSPPSHVARNVRPPRIHLPVQDEEDYVTHI